MRTQYKLMVVIVFSFCLSLGMASTDWDTLYKSTVYIRDVPFAVIYEIKENNLIGKMLRQDILNGYNPNQLDPQNGFGYLTGECLFVSDGQGNERFQFTSVSESYDNIKYFDYISTQTASFSYLKDRVIDCSIDNKGQFGKGYQVWDKDYKLAFDIAKFPRWGLSIGSPGERFGRKPLFDAIYPILHKEGRLNQPFDCLEFNDSEGRNYMIEWNKDPIPSKIQYVNNPISLIFTITEVGATPEGYAYPKKAAMKKLFIDNDQVIYESEIKVKEIIIGDEALKKYPIIPETPPGKIIDMRTAK